LARLAPEEAADRATPFSYEGCSVSWQATAYVKTLTHVTVYEKLLLFVLADYHNTHRGASYPSVPRLAEEALMKERNCYDLLKALEGTRPEHPNGILRRRRAKLGRGEVTEYVFVELEKDAPAAGIEDENKGARGAVIESVKGARKGARNCEKGAPDDSAIRKSRESRGVETTPIVPAERGLSSRQRHNLSKELNQIYARSVGRQIDDQFVEDALQTACVRLCLPLDAARKAIAESEGR
jgi:hypothetical protein